MNEPSEVYDQTGQPLAVFEGNRGARLDRSYRLNRVIAVATKPVAAKTNEELIVGWLGCIDQVGGLKRQALAKSNVPEQDKAREELYDAGQMLIARIRQSFHDAL